MIKRFILKTIMAALIAAMPSIAFAETGQLYFTGMTAPQGSMSNAGSTARAVYLRWDIMEGSIPSDLSQFILKRDGAEIKRFPANGIMSTLEIDALYSGADQDRRKNETMRWLDALLDMQDDGKDNNSVTVTSANFAQKLSAVLGTEPLWVQKGSRIDFNIACSLYRGYRDAAVTSGIHNYELWGLSTGGTQALLGKTSVDAGVVTALPAVNGLEQVSQARCDAPEKFKDHGSVALNWTQGASSTDSVINSLVTAGYDIYRTTLNLAAGDPAPACAVSSDKNIRALAQAAAHDAGGNISLPGLEKVNDQPVEISGSGDKEQRYKGWNQDFAQFVETSDRLAADGLKPGDRRVYYVAGRDITGNYSNTSCVVVTVPDLLAPPAPWSVNPVKTKDSFKIVWPEINPQNYYDDFRTGRTFCNLDTAFADRKLCHVAEDQTCSSTVPVCVDVDAKEYLAYRFDDPSEAGRFKDSDGDGYSDEDERIQDVSDPLLSDPGTACNESLTPAGKVNHRVSIISSASAILPAGGSRKVMEFTDAISRGQVYWYRFAARGMDGNLSDLSAPVRALFPDISKPERPGFCNECRDGQRCAYTRQNKCTRHTIQRQEGAERGFVEDRTGDAARVQFTCNTQKGTPCNYLGGPATEEYYMGDHNGRRGALMSDSLCGLIEYAYNSRGVITVSFYDNKGNLLATVTSDQLLVSCAMPPQLVCDSREYVRDCAQGDLIELPLDANECVNLYRDVNGVSYRVPLAGKVYNDMNYNGQPDAGEIITDACTKVPASVLVPIDAQGMGGEDACFSVDIHNENNMSSTKLRIPCFKMLAKVAPEPPQPLEIVFDNGSSTGYAKWLPPQQPVSGTLIEWRMKNGAAEQTGIKFVAHSGKTAQDGSIQADFKLKSAFTAEEEWCFRARSAGFPSTAGGEGDLSVWSKELCGIRLPAGESPPEYMPWPHIPEPGLTGKLDVIFLSIDKLPVIKISDSFDLTPLFCRQRAVPPVCRSGSDNAPCLNQSYTATACDFCTFIKAQTAGSLRFVAYRQYRKDSSHTPGNFIQVSPVIDDIYCKAIFWSDNLQDGVLNDPFLYLVNITGVSSDWDGVRIVFADNYPHIAGYDYRYQFVYLDDRGEITGYKYSDWITIP